MSNRIIISSDVPEGVTPSVEYQQGPAGGSPPPATGQRPSPAGQNCPDHGVPFEHRTGTSKKSGQPYDFWACPEKDANDDFCKRRPKPQAEPPAGGGGGAQFDDLPFA